MEGFFPKIPPAGCSENDPKASRTGASPVQPERNGSGDPGDDSQQAMQTKRKNMISQADGALQTFTNLPVSLESIQSD